MFTDFNTYLDGPGDLVIEIISKESIDRARGRKFVEYEAGGVQEYWLIDPLRSQAEFYRLGSDNHYHVFLLDAKGIYHSQTVTGFWLKVARLWKYSLKGKNRIFCQITINSTSTMAARRHAATAM
ncbi:TPA: Uma2 family endonuclease [Candidatus Poribacteria bacterium]|nr:Uma2 family endonuclease [Candidatus Poribacteria bacterium]